MLTGDTSLIIYVDSKHSLNEPDLCRHVTDYENWSPQLLSKPGFSRAMFVDGYGDIQFSR